MFVHFIEIAVRNSYIIYLKNKNHNYVEEKVYPIKQIKFRKSLIKGLINLQNKLWIQVTCAKSELIIVKNNFNFSFNDFELKYVRVDNYCDFCNQPGNKRTKRTRYMCATCDVPVCVLCYDINRKLVLTNNNILKLKY